MAVCEVDGCNGKVRGHGLCERHQYNKGKTAEERFWIYARPAARGCWPWTGTTMTNGYGVLYIGPGKPRMLAHRFSYEMHTGAPVAEGLFVLHRCDSPWCVNPEHLYAGTHHDNMRDMVT